MVTCFSLSFRVGFIGGSQRDYAIFKLENIKNDQDLMKIIGKIKQGVNKISDHSNKILVVSIKEITSDDSGMIPKLEHKN